MSAGENLLREIFQAPPVERLQAAIDKLETLSGEEWSAWTDFDDTEHFAITACNLGGGREVVGEVLRAADANLIETLHRTIDAQLAVLAYGATVASDIPASIVALADAILGADS